MTKCARCNRDADHALQIRMGDLAAEQSEPDKLQKSQMKVVALCSTHFDWVLEYLGLIPPRELQPATKVEEETPAPMRDHVVLKQEELRE